MVNPKIAVMTLSTTGPVFSDEKVFVEKPKIAAAQMIGGSQ